MQQQVRVSASMPEYSEAESREIPNANLYDALYVTVLPLVRTSYLSLTSLSCIGKLVRTFSSAYTFALALAALHCYDEIAHAGSDLHTFVLTYATSLRIISLTCACTFPKTNTSFLLTLIIFAPLRTHLINHAYLCHWPTSKL